MQNGLLFANAAVKTMESKLFGAEKMARLQESDNLTDAVRILREAGFGNAESGDDYAGMIASEEAMVENFVRKNAPAGAGFECFWLRTDCHNLKVALKARYFGMDDEGLYLTGGVMSAEFVREVVFSEGKSLGNMLDEAIREAASLHAGNALTPKALDEAADRALYRETAKLVSRKGVAKVVRDYFTRMADLTNVLSYRRAKKYGDAKSFEGCFVEGGSIPSESFLRAFSDNSSGLELAARAGLKTDGIDSDSDLEKAKEEYLLRLMTGMSPDMFTVQPIMGYYLIKKAECRAIRTVMTCIRNGLGKDEIKRRIIKIYA